MKNATLGLFAMFAILSQVACSGGSKALASYAAANNCTIGDTTTPGTANAAAAAAGQVPCSLQNLSKGVTNSAVAASQVSTIPSATTSLANSNAINAAVKAQSEKVQTQLAALGVTPKTQSVEASRAPSSVNTPVVESSLGLGIEGEAAR